MLSCSWVGFFSLFRVDVEYISMLRRVVLLLQLGWVGCNATYFFSIADGSCLSRRPDLIKTLTGIHLSWDVPCLSWFPPGPGGYQPVDCVWCVLSRFYSAFDWTTIAEEEFRTKKRGSNFHAAAFSVQAVAGRRRKQPQARLHLCIWAFGVAT